MNKIGIKKKKKEKCAIKSEQGMKFSQYSLKFSSLYWVQVDIPCSNYRGNKKKKKLKYPCFEWYE